MGKIRRGTALFFMVVVLGGIASWATYRILVTGIQDLMKVLSQIEFGCISLRFLENFYIQNIVIVLGAVIALWLLTGWHLKKLLEEILE